MAVFKHIRVWQLVFAAAVAICGAFLVGVCVAKMSGSAESADGALAVAKWEVHANGSGDDVNLVAGSNIAKSYTITVENNSQVATRYSIEVSNIPDGVSVALGDDWKIPDNNGSVIFSEVGTLEANDDSEDKILKFKAGIETGNKTDEEIVVNVIFTQEEL